MYKYNAVIGYSNNIIVSYNRPTAAVVAEGYIYVKIQEN